MATLTLMRLSGGKCFVQSLSPKLFRNVLSQSLPATGALIPKKSLSLTPACNKRLYGPELGLHSITNHWKTERWVAVGMIPLIPLAIAMPHPVLDHTLTVAMVMHIYWSLSAVFNDYIHGEYLPRIAHPLLKLLTVLSFGSLCYLNYYDIGLGRACQMIFSQL